MCKDIRQLMDEMIEVEKAVMDDDIPLKFKARFDQLKQEAKVLMKNIKMP